MAYQQIPNYTYKCETCGILPGGVTYVLEYNNSTGDYRLIEKGLLGTGPSILYQNGVYGSDSTRDTNLYQNGNYTQAAQTLNVELKTKVYQAYQNLGGINSGNKINSSALPENQNSPIGSTGQILGNIPGLQTLQDLFAGGIPDVPVVSAKNPAATGPNSVLKYPKNLDVEGQDVLEISMLEYISPNKDVFDKPIEETLQQGVTRSRFTKKQLKGRVILPIPNNAQDANNVSWADDNMDSMTTAATAAIIQNPGGTAFAEAASKLAGSLMPGNVGTLLQNAPPAIIRAYLTLQSGNNNPATKTALLSYILSKYQFEVSPESILSRSRGVVPNSNLQLLFNNVSLRTFTFSYIISPRSKEEAKDVNMILRFFKQGMAAKKQNLQAGGASLFLGTPDVFKLEYKSGKNSIKGMNKFKICALTAFTVNYVPTGKWVAYEDGQPASVIMSMGFKEIEPVYDTDYQVTDIYDLPSVTNEDIGY